MDVIFAPAKLNAFLEVVSRRPDSYHELRTLFVKVSLFDVIYAELLDEPVIKVEFDRKEILPEDSTVYGAIGRFLTAVGRESDLGVAVKVKKFIPVGGGLGGGSSDAGSVLRWLNQSLDHPLNEAQLLSIALDVGADVPFFLSEAVWAWGEGRGEILTKLDGPKKRFLIVCPPFSMSTAQVYKALKLTYTPRNVNIHKLEEVLALSFNRLQTVVEEISPEFKEFRIQLEAKLGRRFVMSGSGSCLFCELDPDLDFSRLLRVAEENRSRVWCVETL